MIKIVYIGWLNSQNIGDELMLEVFKELCDKYLKLNETQISFANIGVTIDEIEDYDTIILGGGSILLENTIDVLYKAVNKNKKVIIWGSGYDWINKDFIPSLIDSNIPCYILPFKDEIKLIEIIKKSKFIGVRGPLTKALFKNSSNNINKINVIGDIAFLLKPSALSSNCPILSLDYSEKVIAINWGTTFNKLYGNNELNVENSLVSICKKLIENKHKIYIYTMWPTDIDSCINLYKKINDCNNVILDFNKYNGGQIISILEKCIFSINFKLHASILSAVASTPFVCLGYRFKCFDFIKSIDCDELIVATDSSNLEEDINTTINLIESKHDYICSKINNNISIYANSFEETFKNIILN
ncbi:Polysaccharide pyruvyl transferase family protein WcaK [Clostridium cavendishii DSM 21758]|uniref:Polysaccharide pyruvyl transferase family protein WcaK n=1 Tax=Clostridium cavendishii DSM 21758 TaxID=1121302 RepID=A0A1M6EYA9_9CLOT|nr:polysaccharide pyruvyl transferase family protein [Clostridium cavendishii]SHI90412.1 Polysaccharide pyruvyl transferase family protein WcaK [Clostridium cavendishii DSM 21758]